jgi:hypothetical protein
MVGDGAIISTMMSIATTPTKPRLSNELQDTFDPYNCTDDDKEYHRCRHHDDVL